MIDIDDYEAKRQEVVKMLQTYNEERHNIQRIKALAQNELNDNLYPPATDYEKDKVQTSFNSGQAGESLIVRMSTARKYLRETMAELEYKADRLDKLLLEITKLPAYQGRVIVGLYIDGKSEGDIADSMGKSEECICGYRKQAIKRLTRTVMGERIRTYRKE